MFWRFFSNLAIVGGIELEVRTRRECGVMDVGWVFGFEGLFSCFLRC